MSAYNWHEGRIGIWHAQPGDTVWQCERPYQQAVTMEGPCVRLHTDVPHAAGVRTVYTVVPVQELMVALLADDRAAAEVVQMTLAYLGVQIAAMLQQLAGSGTEAAA